MTKTPKLDSITTTAQKIKRDLLNYSKGTDLTKQAFFLRTEYLKSKRTKIRIKIKIQIKKAERQDKRKLQRKELKRRGVRLQQPVICPH